MTSASERLDDIDSVSDEELSAWYGRFRRYAARPFLGDPRIGGFPIGWGGAHTCDPSLPLTQLRAALKTKGVTPRMLRRTWKDVLYDIVHNPIHNNGEFWHQVFHAAGGTHS